MKTAEQVQSEIAKLPEKKREEYYFSLSEEEQKGYVKNLEKEEIVKWRRMVSARVKRVRTRRTGRSNDDILSEQLKQWIEGEDQ